MFCSSCGTKNGDDANFCKLCGTTVEKSLHAKVSEHDFVRAMPEDEQIASLLERAYRARKDGDRSGAIALCMEALSVRPKSTSCHSLLGQLYEQGGDRELAIEQYEQVLALNPGSIADRVKLDELRGDVPSLVSGFRPHPHILMADSSKEVTRLDYRVPSMVLAGVALMVLGGIFTMEMLSSRNASQRASADQTHIAANNGPVSTPQNQPIQASNTQQTQPDNSGLISSLTNPPAIIINTPSQPSANMQNAGYPPRTIPNQGYPNGVAPIGAPGDKDMGSDVVHLNGHEDDDPAKTKPAPPATESGHQPSITVHNGDPVAGNGAQPAPPQPSTPVSDSRKNAAIAATLAEKHDFKQAGDKYIAALNGAGDDTPYIYSRAAWCFQEAGDKTTALSYYKQGIDAAEKQVTAGQQPDINKNLIRECQSGIKACSN